MKSDYDEIIRNSFSEKIEAPEKFQQKIQETLKQACIASSQKKEYPADKCCQTDSYLEKLFQKHKISVKACLALSCGICVCLGLIMLLSIFLKQDSLRKDFNNMQKQYAKISATPATTETTAASDNTLRTEIPADTESPQKTNFPIDTNKPALTTNNTHIPRNTQKNDTEATQTKTTSNPNNSNTDNRKKNATAKPKRTETTRSPELAQVQTSYVPETIDGPEKTTTPASIESPAKTKTPETHTPLFTGAPIASTAPDLEIVFPSAVETPVRASATPTT